jgi:hypothetical protein
MWTKTPISDYMPDNRVIASNEYDMLKGNINRMFVCDTKEEFNTQYAYAKGRIEIIYKCIGIDKGWLESEVTENE